MTLPAASSEEREEEEEEDGDEEEEEEEEEEVGCEMLLADADVKGWRERQQGPVKEKK